MIQTQNSTELTPIPSYKVQGKNSTLIRPEGMKGVTPNWTPSSFDPKSGSQLSRYNEIALNPVVKMALDLRVAGVMASGWGIKIQNDYDKYPTFEFLDKEILDSINFQLKNLNEDFNNIIRELLYTCLVYGSTISECSFDFNKQWILTRLKVLPTFQFDIYTDSYNEIEKLYHLPTGVFINTEFLDKFIISAYPFDINANKYGRSELQPIFNDVKLLEILEQYRAKSIQYLSVKPILYYYNPERSDEIVSASKTAVFNLESFSILPFPLTQNPTDPTLPAIKDDILEVLEDRASAEGLASIEKVIDQIQKRILNSLGIPDDLGFTTQTVGSFAKSQTELGMLNSRIMVDQEFLEGIINRQFIPKLIKYNYFQLPENYQTPKFLFNTVEEDTHATLVDSLIKLIGVGILSPTEKWIRDILELPTDDSDQGSDSDQTTEILKSSKKIKWSFKRFFRRSNDA